MRSCEGDHADDQRRVGEPTLLDVDLGRRGVRILMREHLGDGFAGTDTGIALENDKTPRR